MKTPRLALLKDTRGANLVEYIILTGMVALIAIAGFRLFGSAIDGKIEEQAQCVSDLEGCSGGNSGASGKQGGSVSGSESVASAAGAMTDGSSGSSAAKKGGGSVSGSSESVASSGAAISNGGSGSGSGAAAKKGGGSGSAGSEGVASASAAISQGGSINGAGSQGGSGSGSGSGSSNGSGSGSGAAAKNGAGSGSGSEGVGSSAAAITQGASAAAAGAAANKGAIAQFASTQSAAAGSSSASAAAQNSGQNAAQNGGASFDSQVRGTNPKPIDGQLAQMAGNVYGNGTVDGWNKLNPEQLASAGIDPSSLTDPSTGFAAAVYTDGQGHYVLAFAGSNDLKDWKTNVAQGLGFEDAQYGQAVALAKDAKAAFGDNLVITGHSLGGGLAATAALATDSAAVTYNAAGVNDKTIERLGLDPKKAREKAENGQIRRYVVKGEILTHLQEEAIPAKWAMPDGVGKKIELKDPNPMSWKQKLIPGATTKHRVDLHMMDSVNDALKKDPKW